MADEFQLGSGNWWESARSSSSRFDSGSSSPSSTALSAVGSYGWPTQVVDMKTSNSTNNSIDSSSVSGGGSFLSSTRGGGGLGGSVLTDPNLQMMGLGLSSQSMDWNQPLFRSEKGDHSSFRTMLQDQDHLSSNAPSFQQADQWPRSQNKMMYSAGSSEEDSSRGGGGGGGSFSLDQSNLISDHSSTNIQMDSSSAIQYPNNPSTTTLLQGLFGSEINEPQHQSMNTSNYSYPSSNYGMNSSISSGDHCHQPLILQQRASNSWAKPQNQLHFSNNAPFWNASTAAPMNHDVRSNVFPSLQMQLPSSAFDEKPKHKSSSSEPSTKKPRNETPSPLPAFKVRKEKMGDRITALQQLISPFGKTDTASVLSEAIEYIKFLHAQIGVLSNPYLKNGAPIQQQPANYETSKDPEGAKQDLRSRGLCLVPVSSTIPVTHETTVDFWNPTFGGTFR